MFMNRVHEQRPKFDSGTIPSQNGSKIGRVHRVHSPRPARAPSALSPAQRLAGRPAPYRALVPAPSCRSPARARLPSVRLPLVPRQPARQLAPVRLPPCAPQHARLRAHSCSRPPARPCPAPCLSVAATVTVLWLGWALYCNTVQPCLALFYCNITQPVAIQFLPLLGSFSAIQNCIAILFSFLLALLAIQSHNTKWAVAHSNYFFFLHAFFFFNFNHNNYYYFQLFPASKKKFTKITKNQFFFHFLGHSNKFIKIYFTHFS